MRTAFIRQLTIEARLNPNIFLIVGDLGYSVVEPFAQEFPGRFLNAGVAEQNMTGVAAGLASEGYHVFTYSIANFPTLRCLEQIRNDVAYHGLAVTVVSVGAGLAYGNLGYSHHAVQDVACLRGLPGLTVLSPADPTETQQCVRYLSSHPGPSYLRVGKAGERELHAEAPLTGEPILVAGSDTAAAALVATGSILDEALKAGSECLESVAVYSVPWLAPLASGCFQTLWKHRRLIVVEEHGDAGGLGEMIAARRPEGVRVVRINVDAQLLHAVGSQEWLRRLHRLDAAAITQAMAASI